MSAYSNPYQYLLGADGVNQVERSPAALDPLSIQLDERGKHDLLRFMTALAGQIRFIDESNASHGDWGVFFDFFEKEGLLLSENELALLEAQRNDWPPHLALLWAFFAAYGHLQQDLNDLTRRHLNHYYEEVLRLQRRDAKPDQVHVVFEPAQRANATPIAAGALLTAGQTKGADPRPLLYSLDNEIVVNQATVALKKSLFVERNTNGNTLASKAEDATLVKHEADIGWRPFGVSQAGGVAGNGKMEPAQLGFALSSPELLMAEGHRKITIILSLSNGASLASQVISSFVTLEVTTPEGWLQPVQFNAEIIGSGELHLELELTTTDPAVVAHDPGIHASNFDSEWPVVRCLVESGAHLYDLFKESVVTSATIRVDVDGVVDLVLQNDDRIQNPDSTVLPFGSQPRIGSSFYVGSGEAFKKSLTNLSVALEWEDPPEDLISHYANYGNSNIDPSDFLMDVSLRAGKNWDTQLTANQSVFDGVNTANIKNINISETDFANALANSGYVRLPEASTPNRFSQTTRQGFIRIQLTNPTAANLGNEPVSAPFEAFGHKTFPTAYAERAIEISQGSIDPLPQLPYTPALKSVSIAYGASTTFKPDNPNGFDQFFSVDAFGVRAINSNESASLVPELPGAGALFLGLSRATAPQTVSLLLQIDEGSVPGAELIEQEDLEWSYLSGSQWKPLAAQDVLEDATKGIQEPGLIRLNLGADATDSHTLMPAGYHWLRLSATQRADGSGAIVDIHSQAGRATLQIDEGEDAFYEEHLALPLPAESVTGLKTRVPTIKKVHQYYPSFGGRAVETDTAYYRRVNERLRHRNRAVNLWDYERILLETYPEIYKVKCLPHVNEAGEIAPGQTRIIVVPDWRQRPTGNPLQPGVNAPFLRNVGAFLEAQHANAFTEIHVTNPDYETLLVDCKVSFNEGFDPGFYAVQLEEDIKRFLSPWAFEEGQDIVFGGQIYKSEILAFVEGRAYVDFVVDFNLYHRHASTEAGAGEDVLVADSSIPKIGDMDIGLDFIVGHPVEIATASRPSTILVSNSSHRINVLQADGFACEGTQSIGIGQMIIGLDFVPIS